MRTRGSVASGGREVARGDRVAWIGYNDPEMLVLLFALARRGAILVPLNWRLTQSRLNGRYPHAHDATAFVCDFVLGALMAVRREAYEATGGFDPAYFMYVEEVDWCRRLGMDGWEVWHLPSAAATHHAGQSTRTVAGRMFVELHRSRLRYYRRHWSPIAVAAARAITWVSCRSRARRLAREGGPGILAQVDACHEVMRMVGPGGTIGPRADA